MEQRHTAKWLARFVVCFGSLTSQSRFDGTVTMTMQALLNAQLKHDNLQQFLSKCRRYQWHLVTTCLIGILAVLSFGLNCRSRLFTKGKRLFTILIWFATALNQISMTCGKLQTVYAPIVPSRSSSASRCRSIGKTLVPASAVSGTAS